MTDLARRAGAREPQLLARQLTLLLDGGLAEGVVEADPEAPVIAGAAARLLVDHACAESPRG